MITDQEFEEHDRKQIENSKREREELHNREKLNRTQVLEKKLEGWIRIAKKRGYQKFNLMRDFLLYHEYAQLIEDSCELRGRNEMRKEMIIELREHPEVEWQIT